MYLGKIFNLAWKEIARIYSRPLQKNHLINQTLSCLFLKQSVKERLSIFCRFKKD